MIRPIAPAFPCQLLILAQHGGQLELLEMMRQKHLRCVRRRAGGHLVFPGPAHAAIPGSRLA